MRLWEQAGKQDGIAGSGERRLTMDLYDRIGRMSNALSLHAESVMRELKGELGDRAELIVEQVMRALIEVDRQGRAIRRPIAFGQLVRETGFGQPEIKQVIEAMRAETRFFLRPGPPENIDDGTVIDVGHEALMRCWQRMADPKNGWLVEEFRSDLRWRSLLVQAEGFESNSSNVLPPTMTEERAGWLKSRNAVWAERYGGGWERVQALITASLAATTRERKREQLYIRRLRLSVFVSIVLTILASFLAFSFHRAKQEAEDAKQLAKSREAREQQIALALAEANEKLAKSLDQSAPNVAEQLRTITTQAAKDLNTQVAQSETAPTSSTAKADRLRVYVQIANESQREKARELERELEKQAVDGAKIVVPGIELISSFKGNSTLRCLRSNECEAYGQKLVDAVNSILQAPQVQLLDLSARYGQAKNIRPWQYELWFGPGDIEMKDTSAK